MSILNLQRAPFPVGKGATISSQWIGGDWYPSTATSYLEVIDPSTEQPIARVPEGTRADARLAVEVAAAAFPAWSATPIQERLAFLERFVAALGEHAAELAELVTDEVGAPTMVAQQAQVGLPIAVAASYLEIGAQYAFQTQVANSRVRRAPVGVAACITPWNVPLLMAVQKIVPALVAGCTVVHKPSELTPLSALRLAEIAAECDLPAGVLNVVVGTGDEVGDELAGCPGVDLISLTGSPRAGRSVARRAAETFKHVHLELGGKSASIVLEDADLETAVRATVEQVCFNTGQTCLQWSRLLVPDRLHDRAVEIAVDAASGYRVGAPREPGTQLGPLISAAARDRVRYYIASGISEGARLAAGGIDAPAGLDAGYYVSPTVFGDVDPAMRIAREEIFGPVLSVIPTRDESHAVQIANDTSYGLHGAVWSGDDEHAVSVARQVRTGQVDINGGPFNPLAPFGGVKNSGIGRECGVAGLEAFLETQSLQMPVSKAGVIGPRLVSRDASAEPGRSAS
jgi:acyl-CoA reductase-like NAD-dependent aldehyde dehydrogenase